MYGTIIITAEIIKHSPYYQGYFAYWDNVSISDIDSNQIGGYLDAKYEVEVGNKNF